MEANNKVYGFVIALYECASPPSRSRRRRDLCTDADPLLASSQTAARSRRCGTSPRSLPGCTPSTSPTTTRSDSSSTSRARACRTASGTTGASARLARPSPSAALDAVRLTRRLSPALQPLLVQLRDRLAQVLAQQTVHGRASPFLALPSRLARPLTSLSRAQYVKFLDEKGGFFYERWGDGASLSLCLSPRRASSP